MRSAIDLTWPTFELVDVSKSYRDGERQVPVLNAVSAVAWTPMTAICGPSGAGKTTLLHLLAAIETPDRGVVVVDGREVPPREGSARRDYRRRMALVSQGADLVRHLTVLDNVAWPLLLRGEPARRARGVAREWLRALGLDPLADRPTASLSGGERQRVAVARALASGASLILADEPTSALDDDNAAAVMEVLRQAAFVYERRVVLVSHDPRAIEACDGRLRCDRGRLIETGTLGVAFSELLLEALS